MIGTPVRVEHPDGQDWSWGSWARVDTVGEVLGVPIKQTVYGVDIEGNELSASEIQALVQAGIPRVLTGMGISAAALSSGNQSSLVTGNSQINVLLGGNVAPDWSGQFTMGNADGDQLQFSANGVLDAASGALATSANGYSLNAFGKNHQQSTLTKNEVNARLVGSEGNATGSIGDFGFEHKVSGPKVQGVFGSNLTPAGAGVN